MKRALFLSLLLFAASGMLLNCGSSPSSTTSSGLKDRAFLSENVSAGATGAGVYIVNAQTDVRPIVAPISAGNAPGMMVITPNRNQTLVFSSQENLLTAINNASESGSNHITLPGFTESLVVSPDSFTAYAAVPTAAVAGQSPGAVKVISLSSIAFTAELDIPSVRYLSIGNSGNRILAFSDNSNSVAVITPSNIGVGNAVTLLGGFDRPVAAFFSPDDSTAYVINCGAECGGAQASVQKIDLTQTTCLPFGVCPAVNVPAATVAILNGTTMYLAGTPYSSVGGTVTPTLLCNTGPTATQAKYCGQLSIFDLTNMSLVNPGTTIFLTDGYHNRMALGANGQLFIGARTCAEITLPNPTSEVRGCLSIYNTLSAAVGSVPPAGVLIPSANGDVTGIQPIAKRNAVYVIQNGSLSIYDATTDALENNPNDPNNPGQIANLVGQFVDVKTVDF